MAFLLVEQHPPPSACHYQFLHFFFVSTAFVSFRLPPKRNVSFFFFFLLFLVRPRLQHAFSKISVSKLASPPPIPPISPSVIQDAMNYVGWLGSASSSSSSFFFKIEVETLTNMGKRQTAKN